MSSGTRYDPGSVRKLIGGLANRLTAGGTKIENVAEAIQRISRLGMSPRQLMLNRLWSWYRCEQYASRRVDWNGREVTDPIEHEVIAHAGFMPPGFYDAGDNYPLKFRRPTAPYSLVRVVVDRFTGLLFSKRHHPKIEVEGDQQDEVFVNALIEQGRLWPEMIQARSYGGATGTVALGFQFVDGKIEFESHDPRWCTPLFKDRSRLKLKSIEKRYMYPEDMLDEVTGQYVTEWYWYRRIIDEQSDILFKPVLVGDGTEPEWVPQSMVEHGFGFCPVVWIQNMPVQDDIDGDPDCIGVYDLVETIDALLSQANKGTLANCDPTLALITDAQMADVKKGSENAIKLPAGGSASYLEISGMGIQKAMELAQEFRKLALEVAQVVLEHPDVANRTATEIERVYSSMITKADVMREQYGEKGIKPLLDMVLDAVRQFNEGFTDDEGNIVKGEIKLPPQLVKDDAGNVQPVKCEPGTGQGVLRVKWPAYFEPMLSDVELATRSAIAAKVGRLIDQEHAVKYTAEYFHVEDVPQMMEQIEREMQEELDGLAQGALDMLNIPGAPSVSTKRPTPSDDEDRADSTQIRLAIVQINEALANGKLDQPTAVRALAASMGVPPEEAAQYVSDPELLLKSEES